MKSASMTLRRGFPGAVMLCALAALPFASSQEVTQGESIMSKNDIDKLLAAGIAGGRHEGMHGGDDFRHTIQMLSTMGHPQPNGDEDPEHSGDFDEGSLGKLGCKWLEEAEKSGKAEELQNHKWYKVAKKMCTRLKHSTPKQREIMQAMGERVASHKAAHSLKSLCGKLQDAQKEGKAALLEEEEWFKDAMEGCGTLSHERDNQVANMLVAEKEQFKTKFHTLTDDAVKKQCEQLEMAKEAGHEELMQDKSWYAKLSEMCSAMRAHHPVEAAVHKAADLFHEGTEKLQMLDGDSVAMGCTSILQSQHNGKAEWFEKQRWYKKALAMCNSMQGKSPEELQAVAMKTGKAANLLAQEPADLMGDGCAKLQRFQEAHPEKMRRPAVDAASKMCSMVAGKSPEEIHKFITAQEDEAESRGGIAIVDACKKLQDHAETQVGKGPEWHSHLSEMCARMEHKKKPMRQSSMLQRCKWMESLKKEDDRWERMKRERPRLNDLEAMCSRLAGSQPEKQSQDTFMV